MAQPSTSTSINSESADKDDRSTEETVSKEAYEALKKQVAQMQQTMLAMNKRTNDDDDDSDDDDSDDNDKRPKKKKKSTDKKLSSDRVCGASHFIKKSIFTGIKYYTKEIRESRRVSALVFEHINIRDIDQGDYLAHVDLLIRKKTEESRFAAAERMKKLYLNTKKHGKLLQDLLF